MKPLVILGSLVGYVIGAAFSLAGNCPWSTAFWRACVAALLTALLARWWGRLCLQELRSAVDDRRRTRPAAKVDSKPSAN